jgi:apolipoprotein D and lipocalin family protein
MTTAWKRFISSLLLGGWMLGVFAIDALAADAPALSPIQSLDVSRYMGVWHEVAKYPNWFQRKCASNTHATYQVLGPGRVEVLNRCRTAEGQTVVALGLARQIGAADSPKLEVRFAPEWLSFIPLVWGDYWVIDIDEAYQLVAVSEPKRNYLWVLSRTPQVNASAYEALLQRLKARGFDLSKLEMSPQLP